MKFEELNKANIENLSALWEKYGKYPETAWNMPQLNANTHWPNRFWFSWEDFTKPAFNHVFNQLDTFNNLLKNVSKDAVFPIWESPELLSNNAPQLKSLEQCFKANDFELGFKQVAMYLELPTGSKNLPPDPKSAIAIKKISSSTEVQSWVDIASESFGYEIDAMIIEKLLNDKDIRLLLAYENGQAVATAMLYKTGDIIGVHQVGVAIEHQGKGIAFTLMQHIINICNAWFGKYVVLQASDAGLSLYKRLGFKQQFLIMNYQHV